MQCGPVANRASPESVISIPGDIGVTAFEHHRDEPPRVIVEMTLIV
jgi:hypothetical protein